ncbi:uncharacterized protein E0L32_000417 [Thyridium curvatum]|uniref:H/ACA ribonucleoprotein complex non-core subunit NAF1 n=1 Tax=Thyridium curvatum TaxID=1093900 RepID=A0A507B2C4_9PEZI|nr:uncharacterized protein E0L32_000417 [Thyridium curvatum]TPX14023.1 hypothetical protein E0L32_000417 [Thyridium curvatum]
MSGGFSIPGLGNAKPNEKLPANNFLNTLSPTPPSGGDDPASVAQTSAPSQESHADKMDTEQVGTLNAGVIVPAQSTDSSIMAVDKPLNAPAQSQSGHGAQDDSLRLTDALEAALGGPEPMATDAEEALREMIPNGQNTAEAAGEGVQGAEWEADSSPYESSSSDTDSSDSSDDEESDAEILDVREAARMLMEAAADGSDDEEDGKKGKGGSGAQVRSKNEVAEPAPPRPEVTITPEMPIQLLGPVLHVVEDSIVIKGNTDGEYRVLDEESVLCTAERKVIGAVADVIGNVRVPMYLVRFADPEEITKEGLEPGKDVYYSIQHAKFVFTEALRNLKGSDASNLHDEEVGADEMEFSDDEKEQAYKKELKAKRRGGKGQQRDGDGGRKPHPLRNEVATPNADGGLNYDEEDDGPYKPLTRPANFGQGPPTTASQETGYGHHGGSSRGRRGDFRGGRGNRGRGGFGGRGGGRGGRTDGYSLPQQGRPQNSQQSAPPQSNAPAPAPQWPFPVPPPPPTGSYQGQSPPAPPAAGQFNFPFPWPPAPPQAQGAGAPSFPYGQPPVPPNFGQAPPAWPGQASSPGAPSAGAFINPAFFAAAAAQAHAQNQGQNQGQGQSQGGGGAWGQQPPQQPYGQGR